MSVEIGGGPAEGPSAVGRAAGVGPNVLAYLYDTTAAHLFDYCAGLLRNRAAAEEAVQETLIAAAAEIGALRDPDRLRGWIFSIARRQCLRELAAETAQAQTTQAETGEAETGEAETGEAETTDAWLAADETAQAWLAGAGTRAAGLAETDAETADISVADIEAEVRRRERLLVVAAALDWLSDRDREVLSLAFRHGIERGGLADTLGVSPSWAQALLTGAASRFRQSAAAVAVLRAGWQGCPIPATIAGEWDPESAPLTPQLRKRLTRHIESCASCTEDSRRQIFSPQLIAAVPLAIPPATLRARIMSTALDAAPGSPGEAAGPLGSPGERGVTARRRQRRGAARRLRSVPPRAIVAAATLVVLVAAGGLLYKVTATPTADAGAAAAAATATPGSHGPALANSANSSSSLASPARSPRRHTGRPALVLFPGELGPSPSPGGSLPVAPLPLRKPSPAPPRTSHSRSPSPSRSSAGGSSSRPPQSPTPSTSPAPSASSTSAPSDSPSPSPSSSSSAAPA
jgi:RNA polymerase sigma factor (sigma-70 family)